MNNLRNTRYKAGEFPVIFLNCTINNTLGGVVNSQGKLITSLSSGQLYYKGANKGSRVASQHVVNSLGIYALNRGYNKIIVKIRGLGRGRSFVIKELTKVGLNIIKILDENSVSFNGCRIKKKKR